MTHSPFRDLSIRQSLIAVATGALLFLTVTTGCSTTTNTTTAVDNVCDQLTCRQYRVEDVIDGDTIIVSNLQPGSYATTVRVLGINTPEIAHAHTTSPQECYGNEARDETQRMLPRGSIVSLAQDPQADSTDKYGRMLAHVETPDKRNLGATLLYEGYSRTTTFPHSFSSYYDALARSAATENKGLWKNCS